MRTSPLRWLCKASILSLVLIGACRVAPLRSPPSKVSPQGPHLASGVRVGEVTTDSAIVWVRLTKNSERLNDGVVPAHARKKHAELGDGLNVEELIGACPGTPGSARVIYSQDAEFESSSRTPWRPAAPEDDFTLQFQLSELEAGSRYHFRVETLSAEGEPGTQWTGSFGTAPGMGSDRASFTVVTGMMFRDQDDPQGYKIYRSMLETKPDFLVATGDTVYYDSEWPRVRNESLARYHWNRQYSLATIREFHRHVPGYWIKDDHDTLDNDCWPSKTAHKVKPFTFERGQQLFREQVPMGENTWRRVRWNRDLEIWFVEGRDFRSANNAPDGPEKTIWGQAQMKWLQTTLLESDATFKVLVSATPIVGPDRGGKKDNHANKAFDHEGRQFRAWVQEHLPNRFYVVCGDRHWQYHSVHPETGMHEFSCGPASNEHSGGSPGVDKDYHRFHGVHGGFLSVTAKEKRISFTFHRVDGTVAYAYSDSATGSKDDLSSEKARD